MQVWRWVNLNFLNHDKTKIKLTGYAMTLDRESRLE